MTTISTNINPDLLKQWDAEARQHEKRVYFNKPQLMAQYIGAKTTVIVAGRRTGKTDSIASPFVLRNMQRMPGSTGGIVVPTFKHGLTNTIPGLLAAWKRWGYYTIFIDMYFYIFFRAQQVNHPILTNHSRIINLLNIMFR